MNDSDNFLGKLEIYAYHEASHAVVAEILGMPIKHVQLSRIKRTDASLWEILASGYKQQPYRMRDDDWVGDTPLDGLSEDSKPLWTVPYLVPDDGYKDVRVRCTIKLAGFVAEKMIGVDELAAQNGSSEDFSHAYRLIEQCFPPKEWQKEQVDAETRARTILSDTLYWTRVQNIAKGIISAINGERKPEVSNEYLDRYVFSRDEIKKYASLK